MAVCLKLKRLFCTFARTLIPKEEQNKVSQIALSRNACWERREFLQEACLLKLALYFPQWFQSVLCRLFKSHYIFQIWESFSELSMSLWPCLTHPRHLLFLGKWGKYFCSSHFPHPGPFFQGSAETLQFPEPIWYHNELCPFQTSSEYFK